MSRTLTPSRAPSALGIKCQSVRFMSSRLSAALARCSVVNDARNLFAASPINSPLPASLKYDQAAVAERTTPSAAKYANRRLRDIVRTPEGREVVRVPVNIALATAPGKHWQARVGEREA